MRILLASRSLVVRLAPECRERLGGAFGAGAAAGRVVCLSGDLGAGKTVFARGFVRAATGEPRLRVTSPTYLLANASPAPPAAASFRASASKLDVGGRRYDASGGLVVHHMDLYRLAGGGKASDYMLDLERVFVEDCCLLEWPDRLDAPPAARLDVDIRAPDEGDRVVTIDGGALGGGGDWAALLESLGDGGGAPPP